MEANAAISCRHGFTSRGQRYCLEKIPRQTFLPGFVAESSHLTATFRFRTGWQAIRVSFKINKLEILSTQNFRQILAVSSVGMTSARSPRDKILNFVSVVRYQRSLTRVPLR